MNGATTTAAELIHEGMTPTAALLYVSMPYQLRRDILAKAVRAWRKAKRDNRIASELARWN